MAKCPNINSEEWKTLANEVGELEAYALYIENGYDIPSDPTKLDQLDSVEWNTKIENQSEALREITDARNRILNTLITKYNIYEGSKNETYLKNLKKLIANFAEADIRRSMVMFVQNAESTMDSLEKRIHKDKDNLQALKLMSDFAGTYTLIDNVIEAMENFPEGDFKRFRKRASNLRGRINSFHKTYINYARNTLVNRLAAESTVVRARKRTQFERQYEIDFPRKDSNLSNKEYREKKKAYVQQQLNAMNDKILGEEKRHLKDILRLAPKDIGEITRMLIDPRGINDHSIQLAVKLLDRADFNAKEEFIADRNEAMKIWREFTEDKQNNVITNQKKLYEGIIEKIDGKETRYYVRPLYSTFYSEKDQMWKEYFQLKEEGKMAEADKVKKAWAEKFLVNPKNFKNLEGNVKPEFHNPQWKTLQNNSEKRKIYDFLIQFNKDSDGMVHGRSKLGYRLPSMTKNMGEKVTDSGLKTAAGESIKETFNMRADDWKFGEFTKEDDVVKVLTDQHGKALKRVAVPFRANIDVKDQSYDLMGMALTNRFVSLNYKHKLNVKNDLEVLKDLLADRKVQVHKGGKKLVQTVSKTVGMSQEESTELNQLISGDQSKSYQLMETILEDRLYGRHNIATVMGNFSVNKLANFAQKMSAHNMLIANALGGTANVLAGKVANFFEGTRRIHYDRKNLRKAESKYIADMPKVISDYGMLTPSSKTNLLIEKFYDTSMDFSGMANKLAKDTRLKNVLDVKTLHGVNSAAEHYIQSTLMYAIMDNIKVMNKKGEYLDKNGSIVKDRSKAMTMDEAYTQKDGVLEWGNSDWTIEGFDDFNENSEFSVNRKVKDVVGDLQGMYDEKNRATIQRYWYGKLGFFLRKWMIRGMQRRWRGIETAGKEWDELEEHEKFYSEGSEQYKEGSYTSSLRFLNAVKGHLIGLKLELMSKEWNKLTDMERANIRSAVSEVSVLIGSLIAANLLAGLAEGADDDEEKGRLYTMAYLLRRQYGELLTFTPLGVSGEGLRTLRTPSATMNTIELGLRTTAQLLDDAMGFELETYQRGKHEDESKSKVLIQKLLNPFYKNLLDRDAQKSYEFLTNVRYN